MTAWVGYFSGNRKESAFDVILLVAVSLFIVFTLSPSHLITDTAPAGGDMASHVYGACYLRNELLPQGRIVGWCPGNYAGFPFFQFYFPLPFLLMAGLGYLMPLNIGFKLVVALSALLLPLASYVTLRLLRIRFPGPVLGALLTLPFLYAQEQSMWGGNLLSLLAGEFNYQIAMALSVVFLAKMFRNIRAGSRIVVNGVLLALIGLSHGVGLVMAVLGCLFFLVSPRRMLQNLAYLLRVFALGAALMAFWLLPFLIDGQWSTKSNDLWGIGSWFEVFPRLLIPYLLGLAALAGWPWFFRRRSYLCRQLNQRFRLMMFLLLLVTVLYHTAYELNVIDIRFLPFIGYLLLLTAASAVSVFLRRLSRSMAALPVLAIALVLLLHLNSSTATVESWAAWNFSGFERKAGWSQYHAINEYMRGDSASPRVVYEHSDAYERFGSIRAFENLPLFAGRSTLEGLYIQSSISAPFVFYMQSEISRVSSTPLGQYDYTYPDLDRGVKHMKLFNVGQFVVSSDLVKGMANRHPDLAIDKVFGDISVYRVKSNSGAYVEPLRIQPVTADIKDWRLKAYDWFLDPSENKPSVLFLKHSERSIPAVAQYGSLEQVRKDGKWKSVAMSGVVPEVKSSILNDRIEISTSAPHWPLLVKASYHPGWKCKGADGPFLVSPCFMMIVPTDKHVEMTFSRGWAGSLGMIVTAMAVLLCCVRFAPAKGLSEVMARMCPKPWLVRGMFVLGWSLVICVIVAALICKWSDPKVMEARARHLAEKGRKGKAVRIYEQILSRYPDCAQADEALCALGMIEWKNKEYARAAERFDKIATQYPFSVLYPQALYHGAMCHKALDDTRHSKELLIRVAQGFPYTPWGDYARQRLQETAGQLGR
jgi:hypothetical protein